MAIDWITGNFYFLDLTLRRIAVCNRGGNLCAEILSEKKANNVTLVGPRSLALSPVDG
ncbi:hypothetical protein DPMN_184511 [Dreissena polymorpha]|uniref:Uncharacterized protein n=3 Tax=Dreissena polymorpha TaxID=45954 RepID=A0A9D4I6G8_DREPO|nr:hypothetical protein DPMN_184511 [Dreissena polymorpha]